jgi:chemotaxis protein methyltransferase CheR
MCALHKFSDEHHKKFSDFVYNLAGINLANKKELLRTRLLKRMNALKLTDYNDYYNLLTIQKSKEELKNFLTVVSTNFTSFFREKAHFDFLKNKIIPETFNSSNPYIRCWSAASSSGEEAFTILITLLEAGINLDGFDFKLLGTDISSRVLELANQASYPIDKLSNVPNFIIQKYFNYNNDKTVVTAKNSIKKYVSFKFFNLLTEKYPFKRQFDFIFCRNVIIYFDKPTQQKVINKLYNTLKPGGYFIVGHSESLTGIDHKFKYIQPTIYKK